MDANKVKSKIIVNGNCILCKKKLSGNRIFFCEECEKKVKEFEKKMKECENKCQ